MQFILQHVEVITLNSASAECECLDFRYEEIKIWVKILFLSNQAWMAMWLPLTHPIQFCILSIIINLGVDNHPNEKWNTQSATFTIGPIWTCNTFHSREMNKCSRINRNVNSNQHKSVYHQIVTKTLSEVYIISFCFDSVPEVSCFYQPWWQHIRR